MAAIQPKNTNDILVDSIGEKTGASGLTLVNDTTTLTGLFTNTITERSVGVGVDIENVNLQNGFVELSALTAPSNPIASGWRMYSDFFDTQLKARSNTGDVVNISQLPVKNDVVTSSANISRSAAGFASTIGTTVTLEADDAILVMAAIWVSIDIAGKFVNTRINFGGSGQFVHNWTQLAAGNTSGFDFTAMPFAFVRNPTPGATAIDLEWAVQAGGEVHSSERALYTFVFKSGGAA